MRPKLRVKIKSRSELKKRLERKKRIRERGVNRYGTYKKCVICCVTGRLKDGRTFHRFPKDPARSEIWAEIVDETYVYNLPPESRFQNLRVCSGHFNEEDICFKGTLYRLTPTAVPNLRCSFCNKSKINNIIPKIDINVLRLKLKQKLNSSLISDLQIKTEEDNSVTNAEEENILVSLEETVKQESTEKSVTDHYDEILDNLNPIHIENIRSLSSQPVQVKSEADEHASNVEKNISKRTLKLHRKKLKAKRNSCLSDANNVNKRRTEKQNKIRTKKINKMRTGKGNEKRTENDSINVPDNTSDNSCLDNEKTDSFTRNEELLLSDPWVIINAPNKNICINTNLPKTVKINSFDCEVSNECALFGMYVARKLSALDENSRTETQHYINAILYKVMMEKYSHCKSDDSEYDPVYTAVCEIT